ncbi:MAG TPA: hypothetical protein VFG50_11440, partial [Rhodothermales bacterium]|nr:hypothetical protein [Rhodothermales bacterium]
RMSSSYRTDVPRERNEDEMVYCVPGSSPEYCLNEQPFGFSHKSDYPGKFVPGDMRLGAHWSEFRDTSDVVDWSGRVDFTSQVNRTNMVQAGIEFSATPQHTNWGTPDDLLTGDDVYSQWDATELYGAAYLQDKLEFKGMIANVGLRLDYMDPNIDWYDYSDPYTQAFTGVNAAIMDSLLPKERVSPQVFLSPRLGISFPITEASKLYFNYGHQRQRPVPTYLYQIRRDYITNHVVQIANPNAPMELTIAYELGYEQSLFNNKFLLRVAGYYRDIRDQMRQIGYQSVDGLVDYSINQPDNYADTRGVEVSLFKRTGWIRGFANYSYMVRSRGNFGYGTQYENRQDQREFERNATFTQSKPVPQPYARFNLEFVAPQDFGPSAGGIHPLGDWRISFLGEWQAGPTFTWTGARQSVRGVQENMRWKGYRMVDMRIGKNFNVGTTNAQIFADITNVFNIKNLNVGSFRNGDDMDRYLTSLHLPKKYVEGWEENYTQKDENDNPIYGSDKPGDIDKDYIDKPDLTSLWYLFPRTVNLGVKLSF